MGYGKGRRECIGTREAKKKERDRNRQKDRQKQRDRQRETQRDRQRDTDRWVVSLMQESHMFSENEKE